MRLTQQSALAGKRNQIVAPSTTRHSKPPAPRVVGTFAQLHHPGSDPCCSSSTSSTSTPSIVGGTAPTGLGPRPQLGAGPVSTSTTPRYESASHHHAQRGSTFLQAFVRAKSAGTHLDDSSMQQQPQQQQHHGQQQRWFDNNLEDFDEGLDGGEEAGQLSPETVQALRETVEQVLRARHESDPTVYVGSSGIAYMLWHVCTLCGPLGVRVTNNWLERGLRYTRAAVADISRYPRDQVGASLLCGHAGVLVVAALMANTASRLRSAAGRVKEADMLAREAQGYVKEFNGLVSIAVSPLFDVDEVLYGRSGFLYGALLLNQQLGAEAVPHTSIQYIVAAMLRSGRRQAARLARHPGSIAGGNNNTPVLPPLYYVWPPGRNAQPYLGMAHGLMGVAHALLLVRGQLQRGARQELEGLLDAVLAQERNADGSFGPGGHYPAVFGDAPPLPPPSLPSASAGDGATTHHHAQSSSQQHRNLLLHWCHGATGAVQLFARAYQETRRREYLDAALRAGDAVWERGLLKKGPGICHGVAGSAYAFLALYRATGERRHLHRARAMAGFTRSPEFAGELLRPDRPYSLFEGLAGTACLWADLLDPMRSAFPLVELRNRPGFASSLATTGAAAASIDAASGDSAGESGGGPQQQAQQVQQQQQALRSSDLFSPSSSSWEDSAAALGGPAAAAAASPDAAAALEASAKALRTGGGPSPGDVTRVVEPGAAAAEAAAAERPNNGRGQRGTQ